MIIDNVVMSATSISTKQTDLQVTAFVVCIKVTIKMNKQTNITNFKLFMNILTKLHFIGVHSYKIFFVSYMIVWRISWTK